MAHERPVPVLPGAGRFSVEEVTGVTAPQQLPRSRRAIEFDARLLSGWYVFHAGEEVRCPGRNPDYGHFIAVCDKYIETVEEGTVYVREARLPTGEERRRNSRSSRRCDRCNTSLEIEHGPA